MDKWNHNRFLELRSFRLCWVERTKNCADKSCRKFFCVLSFKTAFPSNGNSLPSRQPEINPPFANVAARSTTRRTSKRSTGADFGTGPRTCGSRNSGSPRPPPAPPLLAGPATGAVRFIRRVPGHPKLRGISFGHRHSGKFEWCDQTLSEREGRNRAGRCVIARRSAAMTRSARALSMCQNHLTEMAACEIAAKCAVPVHHVPNCLARAAGRGGESSLRAFNAGGAVFTVFNVHLGGGDIEDFERRCADIETGKAFNVGGAVFGLYAEFGGRGRPVATCRAFRRRTKLPCGSRGTGGTIQGGAGRPETEMRPSDLSPMFPSWQQRTLPAWCAAGCPAMSAATGGSVPADVAGSSTFARRELTRGKRHG